MVIKGHKKGKVYIIGAGPGDEGLMTVKGLDILRNADVIIYDNLVNSAFLGYCREGSEKIYVGKKPSNHTLPQSEINRFLVRKAKEGKTVARLKGGDPFLFGRGGEEALELANRDVEFEVVPGVTSATAAAAYAGIPLTHRGLSSSVHLITGHEDPAKEESDLNWECIAKEKGTLVFFMGVKNLGSITEELIRWGKPGDTLSALIRWGTLNTQETLTGNLSDIAVKAEERGFLPPVIFIVGRVVSLREKLRWFEKKPLFGKRIVITRSRNQCFQLSLGLKSLGAEVIEFPTIEIRPVSDFAPLDGVLKELEDFSWIVFTSANGARIFFERLFLKGYDTRKIHNSRIAVIGKETGREVKKFGINPDLVSDEFTSEDTLETFMKLKDDFQQEHILFPGSEISSGYLPRGLGKMGARVLQIPIYQNLVPEYKGEDIDAIFEKNPDLFTFTSSSTVSHLVEILKKKEREYFLYRIRGASIGPVTSEKARAYGITISVEAEKPTSSYLVESIADYFMKG